MLHSKIESILKEIIAGNEELEKLSDKFHAIESEIDKMANKSDAELDKILRRAKELIARIFGGVFTDSKWSDIEKEIEHNLRDLKESK